jgi:hypothetical protein
LEPNWIKVNAGQNADIVKVMDFDPQTNT